MKTTKYIIFILFLTLLASCEPTTVLDVEKKAGANLGVFSYPTTQVNFRVGDVVNPVEPRLTDRGNFRFSVEPQLPTGIVIDPQNGEFFGTALAVTPRKVYTFKANLDDIGVEYRYDIAIEVTHIPPSNLVYTPSSLNLTFNNSFTPPAISYNGVVESFSINPALPLGLNFNTTNGEISGIPQIQNYESVHFIKAINPGGDAVTAMTIRIVPQPPTLISYGVSPIFQCDAGNSCFIPSPTVNPVSAANLTYTISPDLPQGYNFNTSNGSISLAFGARRESSPAINYAISVFNEGGVTSTNINLETIVRPITSVSGYPSTINLNKDLPPVVNLLPSVTPFFTPVDQYEIVSSNLPDSIVFNNITGEMSGITSQLPGTYNVDVKISNEAGHYNHSISFIITEVQISSLNFINTPDAYILGETITVATDASGAPLPLYTYDGSLATHFTFEHFDENGSTLGTQLPAGLSWNSATGNLIGTPSELITGHSIEVRAHNGQGPSSNLVSFPLNVSEPAPTSISYQNIPLSNHFNGIACSEFSISPTLLSGGNPLTYTINPAIGVTNNFPPIDGISDGLSFDPLTGQISGNISENYPGPKTFIVEASNPAGSAFATIHINTSADTPIFTIENFSASRGISSAVMPVATSCAQEFTSVIDPPLPTEFSLDSNNEISYSGTTVGPSEYPALVANKTYDYTLTNAAASQSQEIDIELRHRLAGTNNFSTPIITDFDNDGSNDIVMTQAYCSTTPPHSCQNSRFTFLRSMNSNGEYSEVFSQLLARDTVKHPAIFDVNQDNLKDLIYFDPYGGFSITGQIVVQLQQATVPTTLSTPHQVIDLSVIPRSIHYADINSDSIPDIFIAGNTSIRIYHSDATTHTYSEGTVINLDNFTSGIEEIALTHLNADNVIDIVILKKDDNTLCPLTASPSVSIGLPGTTNPNYPDTCSQFLNLPLTNTQEIYAGNLNGDTKFDLVVVSRDTQTQLITIQNHGDSLATFTPIVQQINNHNAAPHRLNFSNITGGAQQDIVFWGEDFITVLDGDALNNNTISAQESELQGVTQLTGGVLYNGLGGLVTCSSISGVGSCAIDYSADKRF